MKYELHMKNMKNVYKAPRMKKTAGGPSQPDAEQYCHILTSAKCKKDNKELWV